MPLILVREKHAMWLSVNFDRQSLLLSLEDLHSRKKRALEIRSRWEANKSAVQKKHTKKEKVAVRYCPQEYLERRKAHVPKFQAFRAVLLLELFCCYLHGPY